MNDVIKTFENHQSVQEIEVANSDETKTFDFSHVAKEKIGNEILNISSQKSTSEGDIPKKVLKESINVYNRKLTTIINSCLEEGLFPDEFQETRRSYPVGIYLLKVNNRDTRTRCKVCSKLTIKRHWRRSGVFIVNFEYISHFVLVFLLLTLCK